MKYPFPLVEARLLRRYKRFLCDVELPCGALVVAHLANPGSMKTCIAAGATCRVLDSANPKRKLRWSVEQIRVGDTWIMVNTARANAVIAEALAARQIPEVAGYDSIEREPRYPSGGRADFRLRFHDRAAWVEVKSVTLKWGACAAFPDAKSERAARHLVELSRRIDASDRAAVLFFVGRSDTDRVSPAHHIDPAFGRAVLAAQARGVEILAYRCDVRADGLDLGERLPFVE